MQLHAYSILGCNWELAEQSHWTVKGKESNFKVQNTLKINSVFKITED